MADAKGEEQYDENAGGEEYYDENASGEEHYDGPVEPAYAEEVPEGEEAPGDGPGSEAAVLEAADGADGGAVAADADAGVAAAAVEPAKGEPVAAGPEVADDDAESDAESDNSEQEPEAGPTKEEQRAVLLKVVKPKVKGVKLNWGEATPEAEWEYVAFDAASGLVASLELPGCSLALDIKALKPLFSESLAVLDLSGNKIRGNLQGKKGREVRCTASLHCYHHHHHQHITTTTTTTTTAEKQIQI